MGKKKVETVEVHSSIDELQLELTDNISFETKSNEEEEFIPVCRVTGERERVKRWILSLVLIAFTLECCYSCTKDYFFRALIVSSISGIVILVITVGCIIGSPEPRQCPFCDY